MGGGGNHSLWGPPYPGHLIQVSQDSSLGGGQQLASGNQQPLESASELGTADEGAEQGGCGCPDLGPDLLGDGPVGHDVRVRDVGPELGGFGADSTTKCIVG